MGVYTTTLVLGYTAKVFFVRSGYVNPTNYLNNAGNNGNYWSSVANSSSDAYNLNFNSSNVNPSNNNRYNGKSVRCVVPRVRSVPVAVGFCTS